MLTVFFVVLGGAFLFRTGDRSSATVRSTRLVASSSSIPLPSQSEIAEKFFSGPSATHFHSYALSLIAVRRGPWEMSGLFTGNAKRDIVFRRSDKKSHTERKFPKY